jgi:hypothetical protein
MSAENKANDIVCAFAQYHGFPNLMLGEAGEPSHSHFYRPARPLLPRSSFRAVKLTLPLTQLLLVLPSESQ